MTENLLTAELSQLRADLGMSRERFAAILGVTRDTVRRWELGAQPENPVAIMARIREIRKEKGL